jgi:hypothetical protein
VSDRVSDKKMRRIHALDRSVDWLWTLKDDELDEQAWELMEIDRPNWALIRCGMSWSRGQAKIALNRFSELGINAVLVKQVSEEHVRCRSNDAWLDKMLSSDREASIADKMMADRFREKSKSRVR